MPRTIRERITYVPKMALFFLQLHFEIADCRAQRGVPIDETLAAIDQAFAVESHKHFVNGAL